VARFGLQGKRVLLTLSRIVERKGHDRVIEALPRVLREIPQTCYLIGGRGGYQRTLEARVNRLGLREQVCFAGYIPDDRLNDFYNLAEVYVMPCRELSDQGNVEGFGITFLEAGACGLPVIAGRSGGVEDAVVEGETGIVVDPWDVDAVAHAIVRLLKGPELAGKMGRAGRKRAEQLSWDRAAHRVLDLSRQIERSDLI
jgi:phosphatidylinositol alpha-1,6-mannosyltransferase